MRDFKSFKLFVLFLSTVFIVNTQAETVVRCERESKKRKYDHLAEVIEIKDERGRLRSAANTVYSSRGTMYIETDEFQLFVREVELRYWGTSIYFKSSDPRVLTKTIKGASYSCVNRLNEYRIEKGRDLICDTFYEGRNLILGTCENQTPENVNDGYRISVLERDLDLDQYNSDIRRRYPSQYGQ